MKHKVFSKACLASLETKANNQQQRAVGGKLIDLVTGQQGPKLKLVWPPVAGWIDSVCPDNLYRISFTNGKIYIFSTSEKTDLQEEHLSLLISFVCSANFLSINATIDQFKSRRDR